MKQPYIPKGCDQQGRHPEAAQAATELGAEDELEARHDAWYWLEEIIVGVAFVALVVFFAFMGE